MAKFVFPPQKFPKITLNVFFCQKGAQKNGKMGAVGAYQHEIKNSEKITEKKNPEVFF